MSLAAAGRDGALLSEFARAWEIAESASSLGWVRRSPWLWAVAAVGCLALLLSGPAASAFSRPLSPEVDATTLPANLTDVLNVECR
jgi:hypothetical protein